MRELVSEGIENLFRGGGVLNIKIPGLAIYYYVRREWKRDLMKLILVLVELCYQRIIPEPDYARVVTGEQKSYCR